VEISYSTDNTNFIKAGEMTAIPGRWVGVKNGVFCANSNTEDIQSKGYATIDYVIYSA
jgi:hypothetical protein